MAIRRWIWMLTLLCLPMLGYCYYNEDYPSSSSYYDNNDYNNYYYRHRARSAYYDDSYSSRPRTYSYRSYYDNHGAYRSYAERSYKYGARKKQRRSYDDGVVGSMPSQISAPGEKVIIINPRIHMFGAYAADGALLRSGTATAGSGWCHDIRRSCRTKVGSFRIFSLGSAGCKSRKYPLPRGGAPMPYCMFFNGGQGLHGSYQVVRGNVSHGCVRLHVPDAAWLRFNFAHIGTKVIVKPY